MNIKKHITKKVIGIGLVAGLVLGAGGAAFAYLSGTGSGTGGAVTATAGSINITDNSSGLADLGPGVAAQNVTLYLGNPSGTSLYVPTVTVTLNTGNPSCTASNYEINGTQYTGPVALPYGAEVAAGVTATWTNAYNIAFDDLPTPQACSGVAVGIAYSIP